MKPTSNHSVRTEAWVLGGAMASAWPGETGPLLAPVAISWWRPGVAVSDTAATPVLMRLYATADDWAAAPRLALLAPPARASSGASSRGRGIRRGPAIIPGGGVTPCASRPARAGETALGLRRAAAAIAALIVAAARCLHYFSVIILTGEYEGVRGVAPLPAGRAPALASALPRAPSQMKRHVAPGADL